jgi:hypothetical protein
MLDTDPDEMKADPQPWFDKKYLNTKVFISAIGVVDPDPDGTGIFQAK